MRTRGTGPRVKEKVRAARSLGALAKKLKRQGKRIVFTNGCFDLLHAGHVRYLEDARRLGDCLIVGLNTDASVRRLKGPGRPVSPEKDRAAVIAALASVDYVALFGDDTPRALIRLIEPDVLVKGADWNAKDIVGSDLVAGYGGKVKTIPFLKGRSTTALIKKIAKTAQSNRDRQDHRR